MKPIGLLLAALVAMLGVWLMVRVINTRTSEPTPVPSVSSSRSTRDSPDRSPVQDEASAKRVAVEASSVPAVPTAESLSNPEKQTSAEKVSDEDAWKLEVQGLSVAELKKAANALETKFNTAESDAAFERDDRGIYEVVASTSISLTKNAEENEIVVYQMGTGSQMHRVVLPEAEYPELYAMKHKMEWLKAYAQLAAATHH